MPPKVNPLKLNPLQLKTLTLLQELAKLPGHGTPAQEPGATVVSNLPHPHGDHFHLGNYVVAARDASGLSNPAAWIVLERRGLIKSMFPLSCVLTADGAGYDTGLRSHILHGSDH
ncbi:MAG: hypothetical protein FJX35_22940 [Alphaproteobacteria bacterium]|nr:hypothetical protein [Alphaproteobacteria bacterium]